MTKPNDIIQEFTAAELEKLRLLHKRLFLAWEAMALSTSYQHCANSLGVSIGTVKSRVHRARGHVAKWRAAAAETQVAA